jgi:hypothetical protein
MIIAADYCSGGQNAHATLDIYTIAGGRRGSVLKTFEVSGRREARKIAVANNATPWNF